MPQTAEISSSSPSASLLLATPLLDYQHSSVAQLVAARGWRNLAEFERIGAIYDFVRNELPFGYNASDDMPASAVLADGYGQCNTKSTLLMALLRASGVACRLHGFTIDKALQKGAVSGIAFWLAPRNIVHSWVEVSFKNAWINLEGFILDQGYLAAVQERFAGQMAFCGYGIATPDLAAPAVQWRGSHTYIQKDGINQDFGLFDSPDAFYARHGVNLSGLKRWLYSKLIRHGMNRRVAKIRQGRG
ncbi:transglutaminase-like domain-containing protein [Roseateles oligotrophus]|uniref:Transglutaminase family protein n=1 Tax=Roseateles oligotrophus TaxID=1769250 RepID=A0ABT2YL11_9BURK|nr:transglutaminase family protein [Roseateles oligotrophus]MCV2370749.1 transglutaminase family protein [Roseateles oligotrophus]